MSANAVLRPTDPLADPLAKAYKSFLQESENANAPVDVEQGKQLLLKIRLRGREITDLAARDTYAQMARTLGERLYALTGDYYPIRLEAAAVDTVHVTDKATASIESPPAPPRRPAQPAAESRRDPEVELYRVWSRGIEERMVEGQKMFGSVLEKSAQPYYLALWQYRILLGAGIVALAATIALAFWTGELYLVLIFAAIAVACVVGYFALKPMAALEERLRVLAELEIVYSTYWARLLNILPKMTPGAADTGAYTSAATPPVDDRASVAREMQDAMDAALAALRYRATPPARTVEAAASSGEPAGASYESPQPQTEGNRSAERDVVESAKR